MNKNNTDDTANKSLFLDIKDMEREFKCSERHITNLRKRGEIPQPVKLGSRVLWPRKVIEDWISDGCQTLAV